MSDAALPPPSRPWKRRLRNALIVVFTLAVAFVASATMTGFKVADRVPGPPLLEFDELAVDVSSTSLWRGAPVLDTLKVSRPRIALTRNAASHRNGCSSSRRARRRRREGRRRAHARGFRAEVNCWAPAPPAYSGGKRMAAYVVANIEVTDAALYDEYRKGVGATIAAHGGRFLARGGPAAALEGTFAPKRIVILEFPSAAAVKAWYESAEYKPLIALRQRASRGDLFTVEGA